MQPETILYGIREGAEDWQEEIITTDPAKLEDARNWAEANGFDRFRVWTWDGSAPDFAKTINR
jgi:hypothetical protein